MLCGCKSPSTFRWGKNRFLLSKFFIKVAYISPRGLQQENKSPPLLIHIKGTLTIVGTNGGLISLLSSFSQ